MKEFIRKFASSSDSAALPGTQGLYGFAIGTSFGSLQSGVAYFLAALPVAIVGYFSAAHRCDEATAGIL